MMSSSPRPWNFSSLLQSRQANWTGIGLTRSIPIPRTRSAKVRRRRGGLLNHHLPPQPLPLVCSSSIEEEDNNNITVSEAPSSMEPRGAAPENEQGPLVQSLTSTKILERLRRYGISGILSYGILNTVYYLVAFIVVWFYVAPAPGNMGYLAAARRFLQIMAMVWAGSQVTKLLRAGGALALAPFVDRGLVWFAAKFKFNSQAKAFTAIVGFCFGLALVLFLTVILLSS